MNKFEMIPKTNFQFQEKKEVKSDITTQIQDGEKNISKKFSNIPRIIGKFIYGLAILTTFAAGEPAFASQQRGAQETTRQEQVVSKEEGLEVEAQARQEYIQNLQKDFDAAVDSAEVGNKKLLVEYIFREAKKSSQTEMGKYFFDRLQENIKSLTPTKVKMLSNGTEIQFWVDDDGFIQKDMRFSYFPPRIGNDIVQAEKLGEILIKRHLKDESATEGIKDKERIKLLLDDIRTLITAYKASTNEIEKGYVAQKIISKVEKIKSDYGPEVFQESFWQTYQEIVGK